jgi:hypothetical protein
MFVPKKLWPDSQRLANERFRFGEFPLAAIHTRDVVSLAPPVPSVISVAARRKDDRNSLQQELLYCCRNTTAATKRSVRSVGRQRQRR